MKKQVFDKQEIFTKVLKFLRKQKVQSVNADNSSCAYRDPEGRMCAVGCLIPDEIMDKHMDLNSEAANNTDVIQMLNDVYTAKSFRPTEKRQNDNVQFLVDLQTIHDFDLDKGVGTFNKAMRHLAKSYNLEYTKVKG